MEKNVEDIKGQKPVEPKEIGWHKHVKEAFPDREFEDDDSLHAGAEELIKTLQEENKGYKEASEKAKQINEALIDAFEREPSVANFMNDIIEGAPLSVAIARNLDIDDIKPQEGEPDYEEWQKSLEEAKKRKEETAKFEEELNANKVESSKAFEAFAKKKGYDDAQMDEFLGEVDNFLADIYRGKVTTDFLEAIDKAMNYDKEIKSAAEQAKIDARNEKIELKKEKIKPKGDGLPKVSSAGDEPDKPKKEDDYVDRLLKNYKSRQIKL